jgi:hypothetical protein
MLRPDRMKLRRATLARTVTFGSISALFGYTHHLIDRTQYTELLTVVVLSAFVPTIIAQQFFQPNAVGIFVASDPGK